jgi:hypothetical protein
MSFGAAHLSEWRDSPAVSWSGRETDYTGSFVLVLRCVYPTRNATIGSIREARRAGR